MAPRSIPLDAADVWSEMRLHMEWSKGLSLCFLFTDAAASVAPLRQWVDDAWQQRTAPLLLIEPTQPHLAHEVILRKMQAQCDQFPTVRAPVWVQIIAHDMPPPTPWNETRGHLLARLNESREWLARSFARPLVLCLPTEWQRRAAQVAPDLWHVRSYTAVLKLQSSVLTTAQYSPPLLDAATGASHGESAPHRDKAAVDVATARERLAHKPENIALQRELAVALVVTGDAENEAGQGAVALMAYRKSLALLRQLRAVLGDDLQVLRDLSVTLDGVGDVEGVAGRSEAALAAYRESLALGRQLRTTLGDNPQVLRDLSVSLNKVGGAESAAGRSEAALAAHQESLALSRQLRAALGDTPQTLRDLSLSLERVGDAEGAAGRSEAALAAYRESLALCQQVHAAVGNTPQALHDLLRALERLTQHLPPNTPEHAAAQQEATHWREQLAGLQRDGLAQQPLTGERPALDSGSTPSVFSKWRGTGVSGMTTDEIMRETRGED